MYTLILMLFVSGTPAMTSVDNIRGIEQCRAMGEKFTSEAKSVIRYVCLDRGTR